MVVTNEANTVKTPHALSALFIALAAVIPAHAYEPPEGMLQTGVMGGVRSPSPEELAAMQQGQYLLRAAEGELTEVPVEKSILPHDPQGHIQTVNTALAPDGAVYVNGGSIMCKSIDGGRTWTSYQRVWPGGGTGSFQILSDGTFVTVHRAAGAGPAETFTSRDEGRSWSKISEFPATVSGFSYVTEARPLYRLPNDTLLWSARFDQPYNEHGTYADVYMSRSEDGGVTWSDLYRFHEQSVEGGITLLPSGRLLAVVRYQRLKWPEDPDGIGELMRGGSPRTSETMPFKHVWLLDSDDDGQTWSNLRQLTTAYGQCYGFPAVLSDGTVVMIHDTRYGPGEPGSRAMVSHDEGRTWEDEVYYLGIGDGYNASVVLEDNLILTIDAMTMVKGHWGAATGRTDLTAIRWKPEDQQEKTQPVEKNPEEIKP